MPQNHHLPNKVGTLQLSRRFTVRRHETHMRSIMKKHIRKNHIAKIHNDKDDFEPKYVETLESASKLPVPLIHLVVHTLYFVCTVVYIHICKLYNRAFRYSSFSRKKWRNPPRISHEVSSKGSRRMFDCDKVKGVLLPIPFWAFLHCRFSLGPLSARPWKCQVKIYNVRMLKTELARYPLNFVKIKHPFNLISWLMTSGHTTIYTTVYNSITV